jgi:hypothetical protein
MPEETNTPPESSTPASAAVVKKSPATPVAKPKTPPAANLKSEISDLKSPKAAPATIGAAEKAVDEALSLFGWS